MNRVNADLLSDFGWVGFTKVHHLHLGPFLQRGDVLVKTRGSSQTSCMCGAFACSHCRSGTSLL